MYWHIHHTASHSPYRRARDTVPCPKGSSTSPSSQHSPSPSSTPSQRPVIVSGKVFSFSNGADDTRWDETVPIIIGAVLFPATLYIFEVIQSVVSSIRNSLIQRRYGCYIRPLCMQRRRHGGGIDHLDTSMTRFEDKPQKKRKPVSKSMVKLGGLHRFFIIFCSCE